MARAASRPMALSMFLVLALGRLVGPPPAISQDTTAVEIMVYGTPHLRGRPSTAPAIATSVIRQRLAAFAPDLIAVEWLRPSIDPDVAFNYSDRGDVATLARLWGYGDEEDLEDRLQATLVELARRKESLPEAPANLINRVRIELGKLRYLRGDVVNAGYQWWRAGTAGADVGDVRRLTFGNFLRHELREYAFHIARAFDHEYIASIDYQGPDTGSEVWGEMLDALTRRAVETVHGVSPGDPEWESRTEHFVDLRRSFDRDRSPDFLAEYGSVPEVKRYANTLRGFDEEAAKTPAETDGLTLARWYQSAAYEASERRIQQQLIRGLSIDGKGEERWRGIHTRNQRIADFLEADIRRLGARRILVIIGAGHKFDLEDILGERGYRIRDSAVFVDASPGRR